eukprot:gene27821-34362_t
MYCESAPGDTRLELGVPYLRCVDVDDIVNALYDFDHHFCVAEEVGLRSPPAVSATAPARGEEIHAGLTTMSLREVDVYHHEGVMYVTPATVLYLLELSGKDRNLFKTHITPEALVEGCAESFCALTTPCEDYVNVDPRMLYRSARRSGVPDKAYSENSDNGD